MTNRSSIRATNEDDVADGTVSVSEFVRQFVRRHVAPGRRAQADLALQPGSKNGGTSNNLSLIPQSTRLLRPQTTKIRRSNIGYSSTKLIRPKRTKKARMRTGVTSKGSSCLREVPASLGRDLHALWIGYAKTMVDWSRLTAQAKRTACASASITNQLETILRMSLIGARLRIILSTSVPMVSIIEPVCTQFC